MSRPKLMESLQALAEAGKSCDLNQEAIARKETIVADLDAELGLLDDAERAEVEALANAFQHSEETPQIKTSSHEARLRLNARRRAIVDAGYELERQFLKGN